MSIDAIEKFFEYDVDIKQQIFNSVPNPSYIVNSSYCEEYSNFLFDLLKDLRYSFKDIVTSAKWNDEIINKINELIDKMETELASCGYNPDKLYAFHKNRIANLSPEVVKSCGENIIGYSIFSSNVLIELKKAKTISDILHIFHSSIVNNLNNYESNGLIASKRSGYQKISLYGHVNDTAKMIFAQMPYVNNSDEISILSLKNNKVIMMLRGAGHATTIQIIKEANGYYISYFIPKITNAKLVNSLPGVSPVNEEDQFTIGRFVTDENNMYSVLFNFMEKIPGDEALDIEGGKTYIARQEGKLSF